MRGKAEGGGAVVSRVRVAVLYNTNINVTPTLPIMLLFATGVIISDSDSKKYFAT